MLPKDFVCELARPHNDGGIMLKWLTKGHLMRTSKLFLHIFLFVLTAMQELTLEAMNYFPTYKDGCGHF